MDDQAVTSHVSPEVLSDYVAQQLGAEDELAVDEHLADCDRCAVSAREARAFVLLWSGWTAEAHGQAVLAARMNRALAAAQGQTQDLSWQERLARWADSWMGRAEGVVRVVMDAPGRASRVATEGLEGLTRPGAAWQFSAVPVAVPTRGARGRVPGPSQPTDALAEDGRSQIRVAVSSERAEIVIRLDDVPVSPGRTMPLVLLVPLANDGEPRVTTPERRPGVRYSIARFGNVPTGEYVVAFEPMEQSGR